MKNEKDWDVGSDVVGADWNVGSDDVAADFGMPSRSGAALEGNVDKSIIKKSAIM